MTIDPNTLQGLITLVTLITALVAGVATAAVKIINAVKEAVAELKGIRQDQAAADVVKVAATNRILAATPGAEPITPAAPVTGTGDGSLDAAVADLTRKASE